MSRRDDHLRMMKVIAVERIAPRMQRLRLAGDDLGHFDTLKDLHVRLHVPDQTEGMAGFDAAGGSRRKGGLPKIVTRYYTIRRIDADAGWLDIDFVLHEDAGPACDFARHAKPGDVCGISGPCGLGVKKAAQYLIAGDETALPAIARIAETLPRDVRGSIVVETHGPEDRLPFSAPAGMSIEWIDRRPGEHGSGQDFVELVTGKIDAVAGGDLFIWLAGEFSAYQAFRPHLASIPKSRSINVPYWRSERSLISK
jgi:NADPH-dependent ferric siderophore reductase